MTSVLLLTALLSVADPQGDAIGQGNLTPPSAVVFRAPGIFDVQHIDVLDQTTFGFELTMGQLSNPWRLPNGFSFPIIEVYLSTHSGGQTLLLPGSNMSLPAGQRWNYAFRITGDQFNVYRATDQDIAINIGENAAARLEVTGNTLRVQTNITMPESFSVFGMVGSYDPFTETGWREVTREPTPWAFSSREPTVPVIDVIADSFSMQRAALAQGVLPEIRSAVRHDGWLIVAAVGFVFMLVGSVGQLWWGGRRSSRGRRRVAVATAGRVGQVASNAKSPSQSARSKKPQHQKQGQPALSTSSPGRTGTGIGRASRGRVSNNTTRGLARQQRLGQVPSPSAQQAHNATNTTQSTPQPEFMPADASAFTSTTEDNRAQNTVPTTMLNPAVALGMVAPAAEEQASKFLDASPDVSAQPALVEASILSPSASMLDQPSAVLDSDINSDGAEITTSERQQVLTNSADPDLQEESYDQRDVDGEGTSNEDADESAWEMTPQAVVNLESARDALQDAQSDESQDMREVVAALLGQGDEDAPMTGSNITPSSTTLSSQTVETELSPTANEPSQDANEAYQEEVTYQEEMLHAPEDVTFNYDADNYDTEQLTESYPAQLSNVNNVLDDAVNDIATHVDTQQTYVENDTSADISTDSEYNADDIANEFNNANGSYGGVASGIDNGVHDVEASTLNELDQHVRWDEHSPMPSDPTEAPAKNTSETNSLRPAELIKRERLAAKEQLELTDNFFDDAWFEWPNSGDIFTSSKDRSDEAQN